MNSTEEQEKSISIIETIETIILKKEEFITDKTWERDIVDMTTVRPHNLTPNYHEVFHSIQLVNFEIVN